MRSTVFGRSGVPYEPRPKLGLPKKEKPWSHQDDLKALRGKKIKLLFSDASNWVDCTLLEADAYTIKVSDASPSKSILTFFKHQIAGYREA